MINKYKTVGFTFLFVLFMTTVYAQDPFLSEVDQSSLTERQQASAEDLSNGIIGSAHFYKLESNFINQSSISLYLNNLYYEFQGVATLANEDDNFSWEGKDERRDASIELYYFENTLHGALHIGELAYEIKDLEEGIVLLYETKIPSEDDCGGFNDNLPQDDPGKEMRFSRAGPGECFVRVMVAYTNDADVAGRNFHTVSTARINEMNTILNRTGIGHDVELVRVFDFDFDEPAGATHATMLPTFRNNATLQAQRNLYDADVVVVIVSTGSGRAFEIEASSGNAYCTVSWANFNSTTSKTFAHEIGHLYGAKHNPEAHSFYPVDDSHGYNASLDIGEDWRTVMSYASGCTSCPRINNFSNPSVNHLGDPTGADPDLHDAADMIIGRGGDMSDFRICDNNKILTTDDLANTDDYAYLYGHNSLRTSGNYNVRNGAQLAMRATSRVDFYNGVTIHSGAQLRVYLGSCGNNITGLVINDNDDDNIDQLSMDADFNGNFINALTIIPNPVRDHAQINFELAEAGSVNMQITNVNGKVIKQLVNGINYSKGPHSVNLSNNEFTHGIYYVSINTENYQETKKLMIVK